MNTLIYYSFNIAILAVVILIVGLLKPKWLFFWMDNPGRFPVIVLTTALIMVAGTMFGEGNKRLQDEKAQQTQQTNKQPTLPAAAPAPTIAPSDSSAQGAIVAPAPKTP